MNDQQTDAGTEELAGQHVLYRHWGKDGTLLYAGRTNNPPARLGKHRAGAPWWTLVSWTTYEEFPSLEALKAGEAEAIKYEHPAWNIQGRQYPVNPRRSPEPDLERYRPVKTTDLKPEIRLVHPLSREFSVYGGNDAQRRAREWALLHRYYLLDSAPLCAHALYLMHCPNMGRGCLPHADHTQVWVPAPDFSQFERHSGAAPPFILTQPYRSEIPAEITAYAAAHGLVVNTWTRDAWYYPGQCIAIRLTAGGTDYTAWPLETEALSLMCAVRDDWPETIPEWLR